MELEYIVVQAGGKGTRLEHLTKNKPKALVDINNLPIIFYLFNKFPDKKFIIIGDYKIDVLRKYLNAFAKVNYVVVDGKGNVGTCGGLKSALEYVPSNKDFMLIWSDLILAEDFKLPQENGNYIGVSQGFSCRWKYENGKFEESPSENTGVAGMFIFNNKDLLKDAPESGEFVRWLSEKNINFNIIPLTKTKEYGLLSEYNKINTKQTGSRCRAFNRITIFEDNKLLKEGIDEQGKALAVREHAWYKFVQKTNIKNIPEIYSFEPFIMEKVNGKNIFEYELSLDDKKLVLTDIVSALKNIHNLGECETDKFSINEAYISKTFARLDKIRDLVPFANEKYITINGKPCRNIFFYKNELCKLFENYNCPKFKFLHGDNTFSNMMLNQDMKPILIDPRGYFGKTEFYGDPNYDWAKLYYSLVGNYDQFNLKNFRLSVNENDVKLEIQSNNWEELEDTFFELLGDEVNKDEIKLIHAIIWLSLTTYAWEDYDSICGAFYNGLMYLEEIFEKYLDGVEKIDMPVINHTFDDTLRMLTDSLHSVDEKVYNQLLNECLETLKRGNKIIASGLGKNVPICEKFVGSMTSMGFNANFMHTNSAVHGDLGMVKPGDLVIVLTKSGSTQESVYLVDLLLEREGANIWLLTCKKHSVLGEKVKSLVMELEHEGDLWNILPNNSTTLNLMVLQSIAMNIAKANNLQLSDFKPNHPGGAIGAQLK